MRATVSDMGPVLLARLLNLNETQEGVLAMCFKIADDNGLLLLDLKDLRAMLQFVGDNAAQFKTQYGNVSAASIGAIQRGLLQIEQQGGERFFGEPMLNVDDLMQTSDGRGVINILAADKLMDNPRLYATFLLWLLSELFENLPEVGDRDKPKLVFFFDEAHLLFSEAPPALLEKVEQVVRLIRSKGVGVYFVTQNPLDIPEKRPRPARESRPARAARVHATRPEGRERGRRDDAAKSRARHQGRHPGARGRRGAGLAARREGNARHHAACVGAAAGEPDRADHTGRTQEADRDVRRRGRLRKGDRSRECVRDAAARMQGAPAPGARSASRGDTMATPPIGTPPMAPPASAGGAGMLGGLGGILFGTTGPRGGQHPGMVDAFAKSAMRSAGSSLARELTRGLLGSFLGGRRR